MTTDRVERIALSNGTRPPEIQSQASAGAARFFTGFADDFDSFYDGRRSALIRWLDQRFRSDMFVRFQLTFELFGDLDGKTVVDVGCGSGVYTIEALKRGARRVVAVDPAEGMLSLLRQKLAGNGFQGRCEVVKSAFPGARLKACDHAIVMGVMDYVEDAGSFLRALKPLVSVSAAISFPSIHWFRTPIRKVRYRVRRCPVYFYNEPQIRALCTKAGFGRVEVRKISGAGMDYHACLFP